MQLAMRPAAAAARPLQQQQRPQLMRPRAVVVAAAGVCSRPPMRLPLLPPRRRHAAPLAAPLQQQQQRPQQRPSAAARAASSSRDDLDGSSGLDPAAVNPVNPVAALKRELGMQSNQLDARLRERVEAAVSALGYRVTAGQVAARAGVKLSDAQRALQALAYDSLGNLEVSGAGEVVYAFERDFVRRIRSRSWLQRLRPLWRRAVKAANWLARAAFGAALIASALLVWLAVLALTSSRDDNRRGSYGGPRGFVFIDPTDLFLIWDPYYGRHSRRRADSGEGMTFVEAVFSFVFGDGDPNEAFEERRWRALGAHIQRLGGVASAEELAPFLDPPPLGRRVRAGPEKYEDEGFVLPALLRFNGEPFVDDAGRLLYRFPDLQVVAGSSSGGSGGLRAGGAELRVRAAEARVPLEREWEFSAASQGQQAGTLLLGVVNVVGVVLLSSMLLDPYAKLALYRQGLGFVLGALPYLQAYAAAFFAMPLLRTLVDGRRNVAIAARNDARLQAVDLLRSGDPDLQAKAAAARRLGKVRVIGPQEVVYTTERATDEQQDEADAREFERKLSGRGGGGGGGGSLPSSSSSSSGGRRIDDVFGRRERRERQQQRDAERVEVEWPQQRQRQQQQRRQQQRDWDDLDRW